MRIFPEPHHREPDAGADDRGKARRGDLGADMRNQSMGLTRGVLFQAVLDGADLTRREFSVFADLRFASLKDADLSDADMTAAQISGANLTGATVSRRDLHVRRRQFGAADRAGRRRKRGQSRERAQLQARLPGLRGALGMFFRLAASAFLALGAAIGDMPTALPATVGNDYPTEAVADYVFACMKANGETREALAACSCSADVVSSILSYDRYLEAGTFLSLMQLRGEASDIFRSTAEARAAVPGAPAGASRGRHPLLQGWRLIRFPATRAADRRIDSSCRGSHAGQNTCSKGGSSYDAVKVSGFKNIRAGTWMPSKADRGDNASLRS